MTAEILGDNCFSKGDTGCERSNARSRTVMCEARLAGARFCTKSKHLMATLGEGKSIACWPCRP